MDDCGSSGFGQGRGGNEGMSGAPMWQVKQKYADVDIQRERIAQQILAQRKAEALPALPPNVLVDAVSVGGPTDGARKPLARHVLVKDLRKIAAAKAVKLPSSGIFGNKAPMGLYCVFDGQSSAGEPGPMAAEFCARNFYIKVLENLSTLPPGAATETFVKAALIKSFEDLDAELYSHQPEIQDGCGASVALLIGDLVFTAVLGQCAALLLARDQDGPSGLKTFSFGDGQANPLGSVEATRLQSLGASIVQSGGEVRIQHANGSSPVSRSLGDRLWKASRDSPAASGIVLCTPEVQCVEARSWDVHVALLLLASPVKNALSLEQLASLAAEFPMQPRLACADISSKAFEALAASGSQCVVAEVCFLPRRPMVSAVVGPGALPSAKKAKTSATEPSNTMRLRHILVRFRSQQQQPKAAGGGAVDAKRVSQPTKTRQEAEAVLIDAQRVLRDEVKKSGKPPKNPSELIALQSKTFAELCKNMSDCATGKRGGSMCGDLGWLSLDAMQAMGGNFKENVEPLKPGMWADLITSDLGMHLVQRIA